MIYAQELGLLGIRACTTCGPQPVAIDVFTVNFNGRPVPQATMATLSHLLKQVALGSVRVENLLREKDKDPDRAQTVKEWNFAPGAPGVLEITTPRGRGMAFRLSRLFTDLGWNILAARVGQWAGSGSAAFYLEGAAGAELSEADVNHQFGRRIAPFAP